MIGNTEAATYNNLANANKQLTSNAVVPLLTTMCQNLNRKLQSDWGYKGSDLVVGFDTSVYRELQDDIASKVEWVNKMPTTLRQKFEILGQTIPETIPSELLDTVFYNNLPIDGISGEPLLDPYAK